MLAIDLVAATNASSLPVMCNCSCRWLMPWTTWRSCFVSVAVMDRSSLWRDHFAWRVCRPCLGMTLAPERKVLFHVLCIYQGAMAIVCLKEADWSRVLALPCCPALWEPVLRRSGVPSTWACCDGWRSGAHAPSSQYRYPAGFKFHDLSKV